MGHLVSVPLLVLLSHLHCMIKIWMRCVIENETNNSFIHSFIA